MGSQKGFEIYFFVCDAEFFSDIVPVEIDGALSQVHHFRYFLGGHALLDQVCHLQFRGGKPVEFCG